MKISGTNGISTSGVGQGARRAGGSDFALPAEGAQAGTGVTRALDVSPLGSLDALIALQQVDEAGERRRRALKRGGRLLDVLDKLKLALLAEDAGGAELRALAEAVREERASSGDEALEALLDQIEARAAVELAKRGV
jgi:Class II flagellar assembly regulator